MTFLVPWRVDAQSYLGKRVSKMFERYMRIGLLVAIGLSLSSEASARGREDPEPPPPQPQGYSGPPLGLASTDRCVSNIENQFSSMQTTMGVYLGHDSFTQALGVRDNGKIYAWRYTNTDYNMGPVFGGISWPGGNNHFQGLVRFGNAWRGHNFMVWSGADWHEDAEGGSHLFFAQLGSRAGVSQNALTSGYNGTPRSNFSYDASWQWNMPDRRDVMYHKMTLDSKAWRAPNTPAYWHAGGMQEYQGILAVALEDNRFNVGKVVFVDLSDPLNPQLMQGLEIQAPQKIGAAGISRNRAGHWIVATWVDYKMTFYISRTPDIRSGFIPVGISGSNDGYNHLKIPGPGSIDSSMGQYQHISIINNCNGTFHIAATNGTIPVGGGDDWLDLYGLYPGDGVPHRCFIRKTWKKKFVLSTGDFVDAAGIYVSTNGKIMLYTGYGYRETKMNGAKWVAFQEFVAP